MELVCKIPDIEQEWATVKYQQGITHRMSDYETQYFKMLNKSFPETFTSFRSFESARSVYNILSKLNILQQLKSELGKQCDFLHPELHTEGTILLMREILTLVNNNFSSALSEVELQSLVLELLLRCAHGLAVTLHAGHS